jgi:hypothetical protein
MGSGFTKWLILSENQDVIAATLQYLKQIEQAGFNLIAHQTDAATAMKIVKGQDFSKHGLEGMALWSSSDNLKMTIDKMNIRQSGNIDAYRATSGNLHKDSDAILIMVAPKTYRRISQIDDKLIELQHTGKIQSFGMPNQYILGYWQWNGQFFYNSRFNPQGLL